MGIVRNTKSVKTVLDALEKDDEAVSTTFLIEHLKNEMNKTTVYRILERLEDDGSVHSILGMDGVKYYAKCHNCTPSHHKDAHPHFQCRDCGKTECIHTDIVIPSVSRYQVEKAELLLTGLCDSCSQN